MEITSIVRPPHPHIEVLGEWRCCSYHLTHLGLLGSAPGPMGLWWDGRVSYQLVLTQWGSAGKHITPSTWRNLCGAGNDLNLDPGGENSLSWTLNASVLLYLSVLFYNNDDISPSCKIAQYGWPLNNVGWGAPNPCTVENLLITFDCPKTLLIAYCWLKVLPIIWSWLTHSLYVVCIIDGDRARQPMSW